MIQVQSLKSKAFTPISILCLLEIAFKKENSKKIIGGKFL